MLATQTQPCPCGRARGICPEAQATTRVWTPRAHTGPRELALPMALPAAMVDGLWAGASCEWGPPQGVNTTGLQKKPEQHHRDSQRLKPSAEHNICLREGKQCSRHACAVQRPPIKRVPAPAPLRGYKEYTTQQRSSKTGFPLATTLQRTRATSLFIPRRHFKAQEMRAPKTPSPFEHFHFTRDDNAPTPVRLRACLQRGGKGPNRDLHG